MPRFLFLLCCLCYVAHTFAFFSESIGLRKDLSLYEESKSSINSEATLPTEVNSAAKFLDNISDIVEDMVTEGLHPLDEQSNKEDLKLRPGFAFSLGCHEWKSCGYNGSIKSWDSAKCVEWLSSSLVRLDCASLNDRCASREANDDMKDPVSPLSLATLNIL